MSANRKGRFGWAQRPARWAMLLCATTIPVVSAQDIEPMPVEGDSSQSTIISGESVLAESYCSACNSCNSCSSRGFLESDHCFDDFILPISNPIFAIDPRSSTHVRPLFVNNWTPSDHAVAPSDSLQVYAAQINLALTERLAFIAQKDGVGVVNSGPLREGFLNVAAGL